MTFECPCGQTHEFDEIAGRYLQRQIDDLGVNLSVRVLGEGVWSVPRVFAAAHGLRAREILDVAPRLGFLRIAA